MKKTITLNSKDNIYIKVYHLGYTEQGESSIFLLYTEKTEKKEVLYSLVIDCYEEKQCNQTDKILSEWKLEKNLNVFIWTHPHDDHSIGVKDIIEKYCSKGSLIFLANVFGIPEKFSNVCKDTIMYIKGLNKGKSVKNRIKVNSYVHYPETMDEVIFNGGHELKKLYVRSIAPFTYIGGILGGTKKIDCNKIGIGCILVLELEKNNINFLFGGDMDKYTIEALIDAEGDDIPRVYNYIKIPHHGSKNAQNLIEFLKVENSIKSDFASTSVFTQKKLPDYDVLRNYKEVVYELACTSDITSNVYGIGMICATYDISKKKVTKEYSGAAAIVNLQ